MKKSFVLYTDNSDIIDKLSNEQAGIVFKALHSYCKGEDIPFMDAITEIVFLTLTKHIDRDAETYAKRSRANKENVSKRWSAEVTEETPKPRAKKNSFNDFKQSDTDIAELQKKVFAN